MIEQILAWYGGISAISTVAFLIWGWAHGREAPRGEDVHFYPFLLEGRQRSGGSNLVRRFRESTHITRPH